MKENNIKKLLEQLGGVGVCETGKRYLGGTKKDFQTLVKVWRGWPEYLYEHSEIALKFLRRFLTPDDMQRLSEESLFVDYAGEKMLNNTNPVFIIGDSDVKLSMKNYAVAKIYLFGAAKVEVRVSEKAIVNIEAFNDSSVVVNNEAHGRCTVYQYDRAAVQGNAVIVKKQYVRGEVFNGRDDVNV